MAFYDSYLYGVKVNKNIFKLFQEEKTRCHALSSRDGIYDEIEQLAIINNHLYLQCKEAGIGHMVSALGDEWSGFKPWPGTLCCVLGHDTLLSQCLSSPRCINRYRRIECRGGGGGGGVQMD